MNARQRNKILRKPKSNLRAITIDQYIKSLEKNGYIDKNGAPLKCPTCGCKKSYTETTSMGDYWIEEFDEKCKSCGKIIGSWAYGHWLI